MWRYLEMYFVKKWEIFFNCLLGRIRSSLPKVVFYTCSTLCMFIRVHKKNCGKTWSYYHFQIFRNVSKNYFKCAKPNVFERVMMHRISIFIQKGKNLMLWIKKRCCLIYLVIEKQIWFYRLSNAMNFEVIKHIFLYLF